MEHYYIHYELQHLLLINNNNSPKVEINWTEYRNILTFFYRRKVHTEQ